MSCKANKQEYRRSTKVSGHKASQESAAWSAVLHLLKHLLCPNAPWKAALSSLRSSMRPDGDRLLLVHFSSYWRRLACGGFDVKQSKDAGEVISSLKASILADMKVPSTPDGAEDKVNGLSKLKSMAEDAGTGTCFIISLKQLLEWPSDTVHFLQKPLSTPWKWWGRKSSKHLLGHSLLNILARAEDFTHRNAKCPLDEQDQCSMNSSEGGSYTTVDNAYENAGIRETESEKENGYKQKNEKNETQLPDLDLHFSMFRNELPSPRSKQPKDDFSWGDGEMIDPLDDLKSYSKTKILPVEQRKRKREEDTQLSFYIE